MTAFLMAYFRPEQEPDGEQARFAVSDVGDPTRWSPLAGGRPVLPSSVGEAGTRDPFLVRTATGFVLIATDLRVHPDEDWERAVRFGSRDIQVWHSDDLIAWEGPDLVDISPANAGNTWAPKAFWSERDEAWMVIWASAIYDEDSSRRDAEHQSLLAATTTDFRTFSEPWVYLDPGHDVIDASFVVDNSTWYRFSANALGHDSGLDRGHHILVETGRQLDDPAFEVQIVDLGKPELVHAEGPAPFRDPDTGTTYLLLDEHGFRGYRLFVADDLAAGVWRQLGDAVLPPQARHGSVIPITDAERDRLIEAFGL
ncbi:MAG: glycoside hydrolase family 43 protein [Pseudolysinimonas sp.]